MRAFVAIPFLFCFSIVKISVHAQVAKDTTWKRSAYIEGTDDYLSIKLNGFNDTDRIQFGGVNYYDLRPNTDVRNRLSVNYKWLTVGFSFKIPTLFGNDDNSKGETESAGFSTAINLDKWSFNFDYNDNKGYYLANSDDFPLVPSVNDFILFPDFRTKNVRLDISYLTNANFSLKALTSLTERQLKSSGSFIPFLRLGYFNTIQENTDQLPFKRTNNYQGILGIAYNHKFVFYENFYVGGVASAGYGVVRSDIDITQRSAKQVTNTLFTYSYGVNLGYNAKRFFAGAVMNYGQYNYQNVGEIDLSAQRNSFEIFIGYRFRVPRFLRKPLNFVDETKEKILK